MQPINYMAAAPQIDLTQSLAGFSQGLTDLRKRQADERAKQAAALAAQQAQQQYAADLQSTVKDGSLQAWGVLQAKYPSIAENLGKAAANFDQGYKDREFADGLRVQAALESGRTDVVRPMIEDKIAALKNSGQNPKVYEQVLSALDAGDIKAAKNVTNFALMAADGKRFKEYVDGQTAAQKAPAEIEKLQAEAKEAGSKAASAATAAKFSESKAIMDLRMSEEQIKKWAADTDIARQNVKIAAMNAATAREGNAIKREEMQLKLGEAVRERDDKLRAKYSEVESARSSMDNMLNTAQRILNTDRKVIENATGPISSKLPTLREGSADFEALVETLGAQSFIAQIPALKGTGQLSNAEGDKLQAALQNLSLKQSPDRLVANVKEAVRLIEKARKNVSDKYGVPNTQPDVPAAVNRAITVDY